MTRQKKSLIDKMRNGVGRSDRTKKNLERLNKDSYEIALARLNGSLEEAEAIEEKSTNELIKSSMKYNRIKGIKSVLQSGGFIDDVEAKLVGILQISP